MYPYVCAWFNEIVYLAHCTWNHSTSCVISFVLSSKCAHLTVSHASVSSKHTLATDGTRPPGFAPIILFC